MTIIISRQDAPKSSASSHLPAIGYKVLSAAVLAVMFALIKKLGSHYPVGQIVFVRSFFALLPILWLVRHLGGYRLLRTERPGAHLRRSAAGLCSLFFSFTAVGMLPLATATALGYAAPLFITLFALPLLGESIRLYRLVAVVVGFGGVLLMAHPDAHGLSSGVMVALAGAVATALALISIRKMRDTETSMAIVFYFSLSGTLVGAATLPFSAVWPSQTDLPILVAIGVLGGAAQILLTKSYQMAPASVVAPFEYATFIFAFLLGLLVWREMPAPIELAGIAIVIASNILIAMYEQLAGVPSKFRLPSRWQDATTIRAKTD
ncbi:DMT family transporter [Bradyrhizobium sp. HKCCYLS20291]|uniref:DMT family transporter n=1 Tax=Bradyrhizobium sp. HKCCYLS20291 TaxID=3420766 RepID=UPI003EC100C8